MLKNNFLFITSLILLLAILSIPSGINVLSLNGLPWTHKKEIFFLVIAIPSLLIIDRNFLINKLIIYLLAIIFFLKFTLFLLSPTSGLSLKIYESSTTFSMKANQWEKNY
ncbi:MAG: hypothetical protein HQK51_05145, partial [Oligoflexia bacterium]|nr:hypothetical protein [Oligoflexia bacterium]